MFEWQNILSFSFGIICIFFCLIKISKINKQIKSDKKNLFFSNFVLSNLSIPWCVWDIKKSPLECSPLFKEILDIEDTASITMEDLLKKLHSGAFSPLSKAINHLIEFGGLFNVQLTLEKSQKEIKIYGKYVTYTYDSYTSDLVVLTILDVTKNYEQENHTKNLINHLKAENEMLNFLANESPLALWHRNTQGSIQYCNTSYAGALGVSTSKAIAENLELISSRQLNLFELSKQALLHSEKMVTRAHTVIDGHRRLLEVAEIPMRDSGTTIGYAMDITETEELENQLSNTTKAYREILDALSIPIAVFDESKHISFYNLAYQQLFEFSNEILNSNPTLADLLDDLRKRRKIQEYSSFQEHKKERNALFNNLLSPIEEVSYLPDGKTLRIRISPYPLGGILFIFENLTNQLVLERDVNTLQAVQKTTLDHLQEGIIVIGNDGKVKLFNPAVNRIWEIEEKDEKELHIQQWLGFVESVFMDKEQHKNWQQQLSKRFSERHPLTERLYLNKNKVVEWFYVPLPDGSHLLGFIDVSDEWHHEQQLKARNLNLELTQKLKSDYVNEIKNEFDPCLNDILGFSNTLSSQIFGELNEKQADYCKHIGYKTKDLQTLLDNVFELIQLDFDHLELQNTTINLKPFFEELEKSVIKKADDIGVECIFSNKLKNETLNGDSKRLHQAYIGIINDVLKKIPKNEAIHINIKIEKKVLKFSLAYKTYSDNSNISPLNFGNNIAKIILKHHHGWIEEGKENELFNVSCYLPIA